LKSAGCHTVMLATRDRQPLTDIRNSFRELALV
jgi:hypothetical protein